MRSLKENISGVVDLGVVLMIGIAFAGLAVLAYIIWTLFDQLWHTPTAADTAAYNRSYVQGHNITYGFDNAIALILVAITIFILAIAISALLMLRGRQQ
jgi:large-conductance mechanosensitive channel